MTKKSLSSIELAAIINELQFLAGGKLSQIYDHGDKELLLQIHAPHKGKQLLRIIPGKLLNLTQKKDPPLKPSSFCMQLRKHLDNASITTISQKGSERILIMELQKENTFFLIIEFFSKGNIALTTEDYQIIGVLQQEVWKDRTVKVGGKYVFPGSLTNWKDVSSTELFDLLQKSNKKNVATALAIELNLGGVYAEEICLRSDVDKTLLPGEIGPEMAKHLAAALQEIIALIGNPQGNIY